MLYEPTNIVPSTLTNTGAIDVFTLVNISWQVNGNSQMSAWAIDVYKNFGDYGRLFTTGRQTAGCPFYGRDSLGNIQIFSYSPGITWYDWAISFGATNYSFINGRQYKFKITQYYMDRAVETSIVQSSFAAFDTVGRPQVLDLTIANLSSGVLPQSIINATVTYSQAQGNGIQVVEWELRENGNIVDKTRLIDTADLKYEYGGAQDNGTAAGTPYSLTVTVYNESGLSDSDTINFNVKYKDIVLETNFDFTAQCVCRDDSVLMNWLNNNTIITGINSPTGSAQIDAQTHTLTLPQNASVTWSAVSENGGTRPTLDFVAPWTAVWKGDTSKYDREPVILSQGALDYEVMTCAYNPAGTLLVVGGFFSGYCAVCIVNGTAVTSSQILMTSGGTSVEYPIQVARFSPDGTKLIIAGVDGYAALYTVNGTTFTFRRSFNVYAGQYYGVDAIAFSPDSSKVVIGGGFGASLYTISGTTITYNSDILYNGESLGAVLSLAFNAAGNILAVGNLHSAYLFSVSGNNISNGQEIKRNNVSLNGTVNTLLFNGNKLYVGGSFTNHFTLFSTSGTSATWQNDIKMNDLSFPTPVTSISINRTSTQLVVGTIAFNTSASVFRLNGSTITYAGNLSLNGRTWDAMFSPTTNVLCVAGDFANGAYLYDMNYKSWSVQIGKITVDFGFTQISFSANNQTTTMELKNGGGMGILALMPTAMSIYYFNDNAYIGNQSIPLSYTQPTITTATLTGSQTTDYFAIVDGDGSNIISNLIYANFEFQWNNGGQYTLDMYANFVNGLDAGTGTSSNNGFMLYRSDGNANKRRELVRLPSTVGEIKDYGLRSNEDYTYTFYAYDANGAFIGQTEQTIPARQFRAYSLLATQYSATDGCYHVYKEFRFGANVQNMSVSNNANSSYVQNFTPYPTRQYSSANYKSGTLQALIGFVDQEANRYFDDTKLMDELYALSTADFTLFLRDLKGNLYMIAPNGAITMTANNKTAAQEVTISFPWVEIGDASQVSIIQLPTDAGWNNDAQLLDVKLGIDFATGELIVTYPYPYYGTKFNYAKQTGRLRTTTPADVTPRTVTLDTEPSSATSGAVLADTDTNTGGGES